MTQNLKHFPEAVLSRYSITVQHPDEFPCNQLNLTQRLFCSVVKKVRGRLKNPPYTIAEYLGVLIRNGLVATASELRPFADLL